MNSSSSKQDSPILGNMVRITSSLQISKDFRDSRVSGLLRALRLQNAFAGKKATDIEIPLFCLSKGLLNI